jgi:hypothetical protein
MTSPYEECRTRGTQRTQAIYLKDIGKDRNSGENYFHFEDLSLMCIFDLISQQHNCINQGIGDVQRATWWIIASS